MPDPFAVQRRIADRLRAGAKVLTVSPIRGVDPRRYASTIVAGHRALDIGAPAGTPVYAARAGVVALGGDPGYGNLVRVQAGGIEELYAHLSGFAAGIGAGVRVTAGQLLGYVGGSGAQGPTTFAPHLHFEANPIGPERFGPGGRSDLAALDPLAFLGGASITFPTAGLPARAGATSRQAPAAARGAAATLAASAGAPLAAAAGLGALAGVLSGLVQGATAPAQATTAKGDDKPVLGLLGGPTVGEVSTAGKRIGWVVAGYALMLVGVIVLVYSFREPIAKVYGAGATVGAAAAGTAAGGPGVGMAAAGATKTATNAATSAIGGKNA